MFTSVAIGCVLLGQAGPPPKLPELPVETVRDMLRGGSLCEAGYRYFAQLGERAFRAYEVILSDPNSAPEEVPYVACILIKQVKADRSRFVEPAVRRLSDPAAGNREAAAHLLGAIGSERDTAPLAVLLSDADKRVPLTAAAALANIGGERSLVALNVWLVTGNHRDDKDLRRHVTKYRDELKQRLEKAKKPGK